MRILFVGRNASIGGGTTFRLNISRGLIARGHQVWLAARPGEVLPRYRAAGVGYVWSPAPTFSPPFIERAIRRHRIDIVHASNTTSGDAAGWACARSDTALVMSIHGLLHRTDRHHFCLRLARRILTFEEAAVARLRKFQDVIDINKVSLLRRPIEHRPQLPRDDGGFNVVYVGRLSQRKGAVALEALRGFQELAGWLPEARLTILGHGTQLPVVRRIAAEYNRARGEEVVRVLGAIPDPGPIVSRAHVVIGASYCALEAIMQGVAVIGAGFWGCGPIHEWNLFDALKTNFGDSGGGWPMTAENFHRELRSLHSVWESGTGRERFWRLDRLISDIHSIESVAAAIEAVYEETLGQALQFEPAIAV